MITCFDKKNKFVEAFNPETGFYIRSGVIDDVIDTGVDPFMRDFPQLIDIGIMGNCIHGAERLCKSAGVQCYQDGEHVFLENISVRNYKSIIKQCTGKVFQVALGGMLTLTIK